MALIHREGQRLLIGLAAVLLLLNLIVYFLLPTYLWLSALAALVLYLLVLQFFRNPARVLATADERLVYAPADGKVVVIEEAEEPEYFRDKRLQISIFMSPLNVHVNRNPLSGEVRYVQHHPGRYLAAWHPKSSTENERTTVVIRNDVAEILLRQIAGAVAKRIRNYLKVGQKVVQGSEMGFIKFGSRVDLFLPLDARVKVSVGDRVKGNQTVIAEV
jgi:phosphatidylserine decarboxylase